VLRRPPELKSIAGGTVVTLDGRLLALAAQNLSSPGGFSVRRSGAQPGAVEPPSGDMPQAIAMTSTRVDLPVPFSPTRKATSSVLPDDPA
jgi:hypothetical protein